MLPSCVSHLKPDTHHMQSGNRKYDIDKDWQLKKNMFSVRTALFSEQYCAEKLCSHHQSASKRKRENKTRNFGAVHRREGLRRNEGQEVSGRRGLGLRRRGGERRPLGWGGSSAGRGVFRMTSPRGRARLWPIRLQGQRVYST